MTMGSGLKKVGKYSSLLQVDRSKKPQKLPILFAIHILG